MNISFLHQTQTGLINGVINSNKKIGQKGNINGSNGNLKAKSAQTIDTLNKQKEDLEKSKGSVMAHALEANESKEILDGKLSAIDKQISEIDKQISQIRSENQSEALEIKNNNSTSKQSSDNNKKSTQADGSTVDINSIINLAGKLNNSKILYREAATETNEVNTLKSDIALDERSGANTVSTRERVSKLEDNIENIYEKYGNSIGAVDNTQNNNKSIAVEEKINTDKGNTLNKKAADKYKENIKGSIKDRESGQVFNEPA